MPRRLLWLLLLLAVVGTAAAVHPTVTYDPNLALLFDGLSFGDMQPETTTSGRGTFHLTMFDTPRDRDGDGYAKLVVSLAPICLASNKANISELTLGDLGNVLLGVASVAYRVALGAVSSSPSSKQLLVALNDRGVSGFDSADDWPARVKANSNIVWMSSDAALSAYVSTHTGAIGPQGGMLTTAASVECLRIRMTSTSGDSIAYSTAISSSTVQAATFLPEDAHVFTQGMTYPFIGGLLVSAPVNTSCAEMETLRQLLLFVYSNATVAASFLSKGLFAADIEQQFETIITLSKLISSLCTSGDLAFRAIGELSGYDAVAAFMLSSLAGPLIDFTDYDGNPKTSATVDVVRAGNETTFAFLDSPTPEMIDDTNGEVLVAPLFATPMAAAYYVDGFQSLTVSPCTMLGLLNGTIPYWDDPQVLRDNVGFGIPHVKVTRMVSPSSTMPSLIRGLNILYLLCNTSTATAPFDPESGEWPYDADEEVDYADSHTDLLATNGALCLLPGPVATRFGLQILSFHVAKGVSLLPSDTSLAAVLNAAQLDARTNVVVMPSKGATIYPFVVPVHVAVRAAYEGNCDEVSSALEFIDTLMSSDGLSLIDVHGYTLLPTEWRGLATAMIRKVTCDGQLVFPSTGGVSLGAAAVAGLCIGGAAVLTLIAVLAVLRRGSARSHAQAPKDESHPFAMVFTDIQSSTALWAAVPDEMGPALDQHHAVIREAIAATGGYEVKTIGDSFMVAFKTARAAVSFGVLVQKLLHESTWPLVFDDFYRHEAQDLADGREDVVAQYNTAAGRSQWKGLRVRIGVHYGIGQIKLDTVTNAYDYYGTVVNTAARVEAVGHGGQVCVTSAALEAATAEGALPSVVVSDLGQHELRGLNEALRLHQVASTQLSARVFPPLRIHKATAVDDFDIGDASRSASGRAEVRSANSLNSSNDDVVNYFFTTAMLSHGRVTSDDLMLQFLFIKGLLSSFRKSRQKGVEATIMRHCCEQWHIDREASGGHELRVLRTSGVETLQLCKLVARVASASTAKHRLDRSNTKRASLTLDSAGTPSNTMHWAPTGDTYREDVHRVSSPPVAAVKYAVHDGEGDPTAAEQALPGRAPLEVFEASASREA